MTSVGRQSVKGRLTFKSRERLLTVVLIGGLWTVPVEAQDHPPGRIDRLPLSGHIFAGGGWFFDEGTIDTGPFSGPDTHHTVFRHTSSAWQLGGGVEWQFWRSVGAVAEASVTVVDEQPNGILSLNAVYHFQRTETAAPVVVPFVTGGYSFVGMERGVNVGAGVTYRFHREVGLRLEARGIQLLRDPQYEFVPRPWLVEMRLGLSF